jgi:hypothetical protein
LSRERLDKRYETFCPINRPFCSVLVEICFNPASRDRPLIKDDARGESVREDKEVFQRRGYHNPWEGYCSYNARATRRADCGLPRSRPQQLYTTATGTSRLRAAAEAAQAS